jgi:hypothetical protein
VMRTQSRLYSDHAGAASGMAMGIPRMRPSSNSSSISMTTMCADIRTRCEIRVVLPEPGAPLTRNSAALSATSIASHHNRAVAARMVQQSWRGTLTMDEPVSTDPGTRQRYAAIPLLNAAAFPCASPHSAS